MKFDVHVCLVSNQPTPNLVPILAYRPKEIILVITDEMRDKAKILEETIRSRTQAKITQLHIKDEFDMLDIEEQLLDVLAEKENMQIALNATGGTKLMSFAALDLFRKLEKPAFYYTNEKIFLLNTKGVSKIESVGIVPLRIEDYLAVHGFSVLETPKRNLELGWLPFAEELVKRPSLQSAIATLNAVIRKTKEKEKEQKRQILTCNLEHLPDENLKYLLSIAEKCNLIQQNGTVLTFPSVLARNYVSGVWLEEYTFSLIQKLVGVQDCAMSVQTDLLDEKNKKRNELDVVVMVNNVLYIIECKTKKFIDTQLSNDEKNETIYKLQSLKELGGLKTQQALISFREIEDFMRKRADGAGIKVWQKNDIQGLSKHLQKWFNL